MSGASGDLGVVCLGEALVDLICPDRLSDPAEATRFEAHFGGALANVAVATRRAGAPAALAGGCGTDDWGRFLRARLRAEGVSLELHGELADLPTPFAFATLDTDGEPTFRIHGEGIDAAIAALAGREGEVARRAAAVAVGSNTLPAAASRDATLAVCEAARDAGTPVLVDPNLRPGRWRDLGEGRELCLALARLATVLKCNLAEARWLSGADAAGPADAADRLCGLGPSLVVVTGGAGPVLARGACSLELMPPAAEMVCPLGAGDVFMGTMAAGLLASGWRLDAAAPAIEAAADAAARTCGHLGAFE